MMMAAGVSVALTAVLQLCAVAPAADERQASKPDARPLAVIMLAEREYHTWETLPQFARQHLADRFRVRYVTAPPDGDDRNNLSGVEVLDRADLLIVSVRRRTPVKKQLNVVRRYVAAGKPVVAVRTSSHAFCLRRFKAPGAGLDHWPRWDADVIGGHYTGHHGNKQLPTIAVVKGSAGHVLLRHVVTPFRSGGSLYQASPLHVNAKALLVGSIEGQKPQPVAWTFRRADGGRTFYTSLGHRGDFAQPAFQQLLLNGMYWAAKLDPPSAISAHCEQAEGDGDDGRDALPTIEGGMSPEQSLATMKTPDDLAIDLVLAEPDIAQPVFFNFDERGRMWVCEYRQYPWVAGLKMTSRDRVWRVVYDKNPPPPPYAADSPFRGVARISIHEDTNGDGRYDKHKTFLDGLNMVTAVERGRGGVWVLQPPYLVFFPDRDGDDVPDGEPVVHLRGFGLQDSHSVTNSLCWGPDGWLYAAHGSTVASAVRTLRQSDTEEATQFQGQGIWRYHPDKQVFEVFAEGGGNSFGIEIDADGSVFSGHNGGNTRGFHYVQGAYLRKGFNKHGPLSNPNAFGYFNHMPHHNVKRFTHNFIIYDADTLPGQYHGKLIGVDPMNRNLPIAEIASHGATFKTKDVGHLTTTNDTWSRPVDIKLGPDGAVYWADFYEKHPSHREHYQGLVSRHTGRIYRVRPREWSPGRRFDFAKLDDTELSRTLSHQNRWHRRTALRVMRDRGDVAGTGLASAREVERFWARAITAKDELTMARWALSAKEPAARTAALQLVGEDGQAAPDVMAVLLRVAEAESHPRVRAQLAATAKRLPSTQALSILSRMLRHDTDAADPYLPLLVWWALESKCAAAPDEVVALFNDDAVWSYAMVRQHLATRLMRRFAASGRRSDLIVCAKLLDVAPDDGSRRLLMQGFEEAFKGRPLTGLPTALTSAIAKSGGASVELRVRQGDPEAIKAALAALTDSKTPVAKRIEYAVVFGEAPTPDARPALLGLLTHDDGKCQSAALVALQAYSEASIGKAVVTQYARLQSRAQPAAQSMLASRAVWAAFLVQAVESGAIDKATVDPDVVARLRLHDDEQLGAAVRRVFGGKTTPTAEHLRRLIDRLGKVVAEGEGDPYKGKTLFMQRCAACHRLFNDGGYIGPDLTAYQRHDLRAMLLNVVNPNAEIREGFENYIVRTTDGRVISGFLADQDAAVVVVRGVDGQNVTLPRKAIRSMQAVGRSLMPEGLLHGLTDQQVCDLFAYLRSSQPQVARPRPGPNMAVRSRRAPSG